MKYISIIILFVFLLILIVCDPVTETFSILEGIRGRGGGGHGGRGRGGRGGYSPDYYPGYAPRYVPWLTGAYWFGSTCKDGCTNVGNDRWGCQFPGGGSNDCVFASDCYGCGF